VEIRRARTLAGKLHQSRGWFALGVVAILVATLFNPLSAFADTDLVIGGQARISYANGDDVRLREEPGYSGTLIRYLPEGTVLDVVDGPFEDNDGNLWYQLTFEDTSFLTTWRLIMAPLPYPTTPVPARSSVRRWSPAPTTTAFAAAPNPRPEARSSLSCRRAQSSI
jgi:hypothetical protein